MNKCLLFLIPETEHGLVLISMFPILTLCLTVTLSLNDLS